MDKGFDRKLKTVFIFIPLVHVTTVSTQWITTYQWPDFKGNTYKVLIDDCVKIEPVSQVARSIYPKYEDCVLLHQSDGCRGSILRLTNEDGHPNSIKLGSNTEQFLSKYISNNSLFLSPCDSMFLHYEPSSDKTKSVLSRSQDWKERRLMVVMDSSNVSVCHQVKQDEYLHFFLVFLKVYQGCVTFFNNSNCEKTNVEYSVHAERRKLFELQLTDNGDVSFRGCNVGIHRFKNVTPGFTVLTRAEPDILGIRVRQRDGTIVEDPFENQRLQCVEIREQFVVLTVKRLCISIFPHDDCSQNRIAKQPLVLNSTDDLIQTSIANILRAPFAHGINLNSGGSMSMSFCSNNTTRFSSISHAAASTHTNSSLMIRLPKGHMWHFYVPSNATPTCYVIPTEGYKSVHPFKTCYMPSYTVTAGCFRFYHDVRCSPFAKSEEYTEGSTARERKSFSICDVANDAIIETLNLVPTPEPNTGFGDMAILYRSGLGAGHWFPEGVQCGSLSDVARCSIFKDPSGDIQTIRVSTHKCFWLCMSENCTSEDEWNYLVNTTSTLEHTFEIKSVYLFYCTCEQYKRFRNNDADTNDPTAENEWPSTVILTTLLLLLVIIATPVLYLLWRYYSGMPMEIKAEQIERLAGLDEAFEENVLDYAIDYTRLCPVEGAPVLGRGEHGVVLLGNLMTYTDDDRSLEEEMKVALKLTRACTNAKQLHRLVEEIKICIVAKGHVNIVNFTGFALPTRRPGGSLLQYIKRPEYQAHLACRSSAETVRYGRCQLLVGSWWVQMAAGMEHLHAKNIIHGDLAARNCLLDSNLVLKISDFGMSSMATSGVSVIKGRKSRLPWKWMPPESLEEFKLSFGSDVWSFGVTLWEIFSGGEVPFPAANWDRHFVTSIKEGTRLTQPLACPDECFKWMQQCWNLNSEERPNFSKLRKMGDDMPRVDNGYYQASTD